MQEHELTFSCKEITLFEQRYVNGYDLTHDMRYNKWLSIFHPGSEGRQCVFRYTVKKKGVCVIS